MNLRGTVKNYRFYLLVLICVTVGGIVWTRAKMSRAVSVPDGHRFHTMLVNGMERKSLLHVPTSYKRTSPVPLLIMLHGMGGTALLSQRETGWSDKSDTEGFIVVYPEATRPDPLKPPSLRYNPQAWNDGSGRFHAADQNIDDVAFIKSLIHNLADGYAIDPNRVFVTGFSNGASMTFRIGAELADQVAAIAPHSGSCWTENLSPARSISVCYLTGASDTLNPIEGGFPKLAFGGKDQGGRSKPPVMAMITKWAKAMDCHETQSSEKYESGFQTKRFGPGRDHAEVVYYNIQGLGHHWAGGTSQAPEFLVGKNTTKLKATDVIWDFFATVSHAR